LFRSFGSGDSAAFARFVSVFAVVDRSYRFETLRRSAPSGGAGVTSALSSQRWCCSAAPTRLWFGCTDPALTGASIAIADTRRVYELLPSSVRKRWSERGLEYTRSYPAGSDDSWVRAFGTPDRQRIEDTCRAQGVRVQWLAQGELRLTRTCNPIDTHWRTHERVWCGAVPARSSADRPPRAHVCHADGSAIAAADLEQVRAAFAEAAMLVPWEAGDVIVLDSRLTAHAHAPGGAGLELHTARELAGDAVADAIDLSQG
jgi:hypothetical protein